MLLDLILVGFNTLVAAGGTLHWHLALDKAYRRCQRQGWIEKRTDGQWCITAKVRVVLDDTAANPT